MTTCSKALQNIGGHDSVLCMSACASLLS